MKSLREWRIDRLLGQRALAEKAGVSNKTIVAIEKGGHPPRLRTIRRLSEALEVDPYEVKEFAEELNRKKEQ